MRRGINGLAELVQSSFKLDPFSEALFAFCNRRRNRIKILEWDIDGFWIYFKRLERGSIHWPGASGETTMALTVEELSVLLSGTKVKLKISRNEITGRKIS
jgi:transposase